VTAEHLNPGHMTPNEFRALGHRVVDWIAAYWEGLPGRAVAPPVVLGAVRARLPQHPPQTGDGFDAFLGDVSDIVLPALLHWQHPRFFGYFPANGSGPAVLAELLTAGLGVQGMNWNTSPACTEVEQRMTDWFVTLLGLPERFRGGGVIQDTASSGLLMALVAALHRASGGHTRTAGTGNGRFRVYVTGETHSAAEKAAVVAGLGLDAVVTVATSANGAMEAADLDRLLTADRSHGRTPVLVVTTRGTTSRLSFDPIERIGPICSSHDVWLHVDAAYAGVAAICEETRWVNDGVEHADSYCTNPHKWLLTNFDCDLFWMADPAPLQAAMDTRPEYLQNAASDSGEVTDYRHWQIPLGRRFRALKLWAVLRWYGAEGLRTHIRSGIRHARLFARLVRSDNRFELVTPPTLALVPFRLRGSDQANRVLLEAVNNDGTTFLTHSERDGTVFLRFAAGGTFTTDHHVHEAWNVIQRLTS
jgi:aromatic-L-amino-acid decarboxylase